MARNDQVVRVLHVLRRLEAPGGATLAAALAKVQTALPPAGAAYLQQLQGVFAVGLGPHKRYRDHREMVDRLSQAIARRRTVQMRYYSASRDRARRRSRRGYATPRSASCVWTWTGGRRRGRGVRDGEPCGRCWGDPRSKSNVLIAV